MSTHIEEDPSRYNKKIIGFDTFADFPSIAGQDGSDTIAWKEDMGLSQYKIQRSPLTASPAYIVID
jgi:hypothetical protein